MSCLNPLRKEPSRVCYLGILRLSYLAPVIEGDEGMSLLISCNLVHSELTISSSNSLASLTMKIHNAINNICVISKH